MEANRETDNKTVIEFYENRCCMCHATFFQKRRGRLRRTCSRGCRQQLYLMRHRKDEEEREKREIISKKVKAESGCPVCGEALIQPSGRGRKRKTCSEACRKRLWREQNPSCRVCGETFKIGRYQRKQYYCSDKCQLQAMGMRKLHRRRKRQMAEIGNYRPDWLARPGSGYQEEVVPRQDGVTEIIREREPHPNHESPEWMRTSAGWMAHEAEERARHEAVQMAELEVQKAELETRKAAEEKKKREDRSLHKFLFDTEW